MTGARGNEWIWAIQKKTEEIPQNWLHIFSIHIDPIPPKMAQFWNLPVFFGLSRFPLNKWQDIHPSFEPTWSELITQLGKGHQLHPFSRSLTTEVSSPRRGPQPEELGMGFCWEFLIFAYFCGYWTVGIGLIHIFSDFFPRYKVDTYYCK